ncbi:hypothetical protein SALBM135S_01513 [Streptomyces alboniger]
MLWVATQTRKTAPGIRCPQWRTTAGSRTGQSTAAITRRSTASGRTPSSARRVPSTQVAATAVSAGGVYDSASQRERRRSSRTAKSAASPSQAAPARASATRESVSWPMRYRPTEMMPVAITADPAAGERPDHQAARRASREAGRESPAGRPCCSPGSVRSMDPA